MSRARLKQLIVSVVILTFMVSVSIGAYYCISACIRKSRSRAAAAAEGHIVPRQEWPQTFVDLLKNAEQQGMKVSNVRVYQRAYDEYYWMSDASPESLALMNRRWQLRAVKEDHKLVRRFQDRMPTSLVASSHPDGASYYLSSNWLAGEKGDLYCVMADQTNRLVIVRYYYNF